MNVDRLPFDDGFFDLVTLTEVLEHLYDTDHLIMRWMRFDVS